ncbi:MAG TPA: pre-peptidase C-terminal domain-containing protein [Bdellovibrionales bacterium]|nr:pre-peptidase C-terminal domain-containing protein [Bdellovibrionales bacterium]
MGKAYWGAVFSILLLAACSQTSPAGARLEPSYCEQAKVYQNPITVSGRALYQRRQFTGSGLGDTDPTSYPIRYAEIAVWQDEQFLIQCATTDGSGNFEFQVPSTGLTYTLRLYSRGQNAYVNASVLNSPSENEPYELTTTFVATGSPSLSDLVAPAKGTLEGGAFNIFDQIVKANEFLRNQTLSCSASFSDCSPFTVAPKAVIYWAKGVNPASYFGLSAGISFYSKDTKALYILGGLTGDVDREDTDHFDNSVIIHEYGHFIEDHYSATDSPGGSHDANSIVDPRLAWGEGWANYFSLAVTGDPVYRDTSGNSDGVTYYFFSNNLETNSPSRDVPTSPGEGNFREFAITRALWDMLDPHPVTGAGTNEAMIDSATAPFSEFWTVFSGASGIKNTSYHFRNYGLFMQLHDALAGRTSLASIFTAELQRADQADYAATYATGGTCTYSMATTSVGEDGSPDTSNQLDSNDFYYLNHAGGTLTINLNRTAGTADLDLYLYDSDYVFGRESDIVASSTDPSPGDGGTEAVSLNLPAGKYMINVNLYTEQSFGNQSASYKLLLNGAELCP